MIALRLKYALGSCTCMVAVAVAVAMQPLTCVARTLNVVVVVNGPVGKFSAPPVPFTARPKAVFPLYSR